uniref:Homing endonuclease LAGLIDADG domain-containing protein n=1 Tax=Orbilia brochopaga TaxID=3140254 RepID=A0A4Y5MXR7_9PEZI|nr:hypothetical protein [Drechslerella brochopaga]
MVDYRILIEVLILIFFKQSLSKIEYLFFVFNILSHYCTIYPKVTTSVRLGVKSYGLEFFSRALPCFSELHSLFYPNGTKIIPQNIYELLTPGSSRLSYKKGGGEWNS